MSWKKYGGTNNYDQLSNLSLNNLVVDQLSIKTAYLGTFTICGELIVDGSTIVNNDYKVLGNLLANQNFSVKESIQIDQNVLIRNNLTTNGNTFLYNKLYLVGPNGEGYNSNTNTGNIFILGSATGIGINNTNPDAILDIFGDNSKILNVKSSQSQNRNILARNNQNSGIVLSVDNSNNNRSYLEFYQTDLPIGSLGDTGVGGGRARIWYEPGGNLFIDTSTNVTILSRISLSYRKDAIASHINNETMVIYDISSSIFLPNEFNNPNIYSGTALSLISTDTCSNTFMYISTPESMGWLWGAGIYPNDSTRHMGTMGWNDISNNTYVPTEIVVSGNSHIKNRSTIGINKYTPITEKYVLDINGPVRINHNEIHLMIDINFEILSMTFSKINPLLGIAIGTGTGVGSNQNYTLKYYVLYTSNGGDIWNISEIIDTVTNISNANLTFHSSIYDINNIFVSSNSQFAYISKDGGITWNYLNISPTILSRFPFTTPTICMNMNPNTNLFLFLAYSKTPNTHSIYHYDRSYKYIGYTDSSLNVINSSFLINTLYFVAGNGIETYIISGDSLIQFFYMNELPDYSYVSIKAINIGLNLSNIVIAIGNKSTNISAPDSVISYSFDSGNNWNHTRFFNKKINDIFIWDISNAIVVGNNGLILYSTDSFNTWKTLSFDQINAMGNENNILDTTHDIVSIHMPAVDTFIFSCVVNHFNFNKQNGETKIYTAYLPNLFNRYAHDPLFDISGNMEISGDIHINDDGKLQSNNSTFYILDDTVKSVYFAGDASNIHIGNSIPGGTTYIRHQLDVSDNTHLHANLIVDGIETITNLTNTNGLYTGALRVFGGTSINKEIYIGGSAIIYHDISLNGSQVTQGNLFVHSNTFLGDTSSNVLKVQAKSEFYTDVSMNTLLFVGGDVSMNANLFVNKDVSFNKRLFVQEDVSFNANAFVQSKLVVSGDASFNKRLFVQEDVSFNANAFVQNKLVVSGDASFNSRLFVQQDVSFNANAFVQNKLVVSGDASFNSKLFVQKDASFNANVYVYGKSLFEKQVFINGDVSLNANVYMKDNVWIDNYNNNTLNVNAVSFFNNNTTIQNLNVLNDLSVNNQLITENIDGNNSNLHICSKNSKVGNIYIGDSLTKKYIQIGTNQNIENVVNIYGNITLIGNTTITSLTTLTQEELVIQSAYLYINQDGQGPNSSSNAGVYFYDFSGGNPKAGFLKNSDNRTSMVFKSTSSYHSIALEMPLLIPSFTNNKKNNILILQNPEELIDASFSIVSANIDISGIFIRDNSNSTSTNQIVNSDVAIIGNLMINKNIHSISNADVDISGNSIISKLGIGTNYVNSNYTLDVSGDIHHSTGWIVQF